MNAIPVNPVDGIYPASSDYIHAIEVSGAARFLFVSGTMGLDESGAAPKALEDQLAQIWKNIRRILAEAGMRTANIVRLTSYLREAGYAEANAKARSAALGSRRVPTTAIVVETLSPRLAGRDRGHRGCMKPDICENQEAFLR